MRSLRNLADRALSRLPRRTPERLWVHYCFALAIILCLIIATHLLNRTMITRGLAAAEQIKSSNSQTLLAQQIMNGVDAHAAGESISLPPFHKAIMRLETAHYAFVSFDIRSSELNSYLFGKEQALHQGVRDFIALAKRFASETPDARAEIAVQMNELFGVGGVREGLLQTATLVTEHVEAEANYFTYLQRSMLAASALVLLAEALFIFWPAQNLVQSTIRKMKRQTNELRVSQTKLKQMNAQLKHIVNHDQLTGLPNRASLTSHLADFISERRLDDWGLLLVGLDDFKSVNDMVGHDQGDALLISVSRALQSCVDFDNLIARVGGDEFVLISNEPTPSLIRRIMDSLAEPFEVEGRRIPINASIGYLQIGESFGRPFDILADAEIALQCAKNAGGNRAQSFTEHLRDDLRVMHNLQLELADAIQNGEIEPWFQPQIRLSNGKLHGAEVLARWRHPTRGMLTPDAFLPAAERAGLMVDLDHAIWKSAMNHASQWQAAEIWYPSISLNAAPDTIADPYLVERFLLTLQRSGLHANQVIVEVLETTLINGKDDMAAINIDSLAECGIALELDDFGTGYASLSKLTQLPLAGIKLDRSLISPLPDQAADSVVRAILALATELGLHVIAEGVEESLQATHLCERGCGFGQGYGFGRPMPASEFTSWLETNAKNAVVIGPDIARSA